MSSCLVRQLFRQKIGQELDQAIVDEVLFPLLRQRKHGPRDLLLDIKMTRRWDEHGDSMITRPGRRAVTRRGRYTLEKNMSPFTRIPSTLESVRADQEVKERKRLGKLNSRFRREMTMRKKWGTVDILNELRELKHPVIECHPVPDGTRHIDHPWEIYPKDEFPADAYIRLEEMSDSRLREIVVAGCDLCGSWSKSPLYSNDKMLRNKEKAIIKEDLLFVNRYLEHSLSNGGLYWVNRRYIHDHFSYAPCLISSFPGY
jgi:hypothetical protein